MASRSAQIGGCSTSLSLPALVQAVSTFQFAASMQATSGEVAQIPRGLLERLTQVACFPA
jgi:hypothetical protein